MALPHYLAHINPKVHSCSQMISRSGLKPKDHEVFFHRLPSPDSFECPSTQSYASFKVLQMSAYGYNIGKTSFLRL